MTILSQELDTFEANRPRLLAAAKGKWVLIKGDRVVDTFESRADAVNRGHQEFGDVPFLTKRIAEIEIPLTFTSIFVKA